MPREHSGLPGRAQRAEDAPVPTLLGGGERRLEGTCDDLRGLEPVWTATPLQP